MRMLATLMVQVTDLERSVAFYEALLGIRFHRPTPETAMVVPGGERGAVALMLEQASAPRAESAVTFALQDTDELAQLMDRVAGPDGSTEPMPAGDVQRLRDPDGNELELLVLSAEAAKWWRAAAGGSDGSEDAG